MSGFLFPSSKPPVFPGYTAANFAANWGNLGGGFAPVASYKDSTGRVFLRGIANALIGGLLPTQNIFTLPATFRPQFDTDLICMGAGATGGITFITLKITAAGGIVMGTSIAGGTSDTFNFVSFDGVSFQTN